MLAAVDRMQRAELHSRLALVRLRNGLGDMAAAIGRAKAKAAGADEATRATDTAALLDEFEHLVDAMLEIAGGMIPRSRAQAAQPVQAASEAPVLETPAPPEPAAPAPAAETDQVPTISGMAANLAAGQAEEPATANPHDNALAAAAAGPTVEMLRSLVEALNASIPAEPQSVEPQAAAPQTAEQPPAETLAVAEPPVQEAAAELAQQASPESVAEPAAAIGQEPAQASVQASVQESVQEPRISPESVQETAQQTVEAIEPPLFDVVVEFDRAEPDAASDAATIAEPEAPAEPTEVAATAEAVATPSLR